MTTRRVLTDEMWSCIEQLLPDRTPRRGGRWRDHREVLEAIIWRTRTRTGSPWRDLPADFSSYQTVWYRFDRWAKDGTLDRVLTVLQGRAQAAGDLEWDVSVDLTIAGAHQHAAGAPRVLRGGTSEFHGFVA